MSVILMAATWLQLKFPNLCLGIDLTAFRITDLSIGGNLTAIRVTNLRLGDNMTAFAVVDPDHDDEVPAVHRVPQVRLNLHKGFKTKLQSVS